MTPEQIQMLRTLAQSCPCPSLTAAVAKAVEKTRIATWAAREGSTGMQAAHGALADEAWLAAEEISRRYYSRPVHQLKPE